MCETCSKLTIKTFVNVVRSAVFIVNFEQISHFGISIVDFEEVNAGWVEYELQITDFDVTGYTITQGMRGHIK